MNYIPFIANLYQNAKEKNILAGVVIIDLISFISYIIFSAGFFYLGDLQMVIGCIVGTYFSLKNIKSNQSFIKHGIMVSLGGTILSAISMSFFDWIIFWQITGFSLFSFLVIFGLFSIEALIIGLIIGGILGGYYHHTNKKGIETSPKEDEFYESLIEK